MRKMTLRSKHLLLHVVILTALACRILIYGQAGHLSSCSWPSSWCQVNRELCNVKWTMHRYGGCQFIWNTLWRIFFSWPAEVISPAPLLSERLSPLWLPQVLNQSLSCQCTCVGYIWWGTMSQVNTWLPLAFERKQIEAWSLWQNCPTSCQGGITCGAIDKPRKSSKAIEKRIIITFRDKNVVIACFRDKNVVYLIYLYVYIFHWASVCVLLQWLECLYIYYKLLYI